MNFGDFSMRDMHIERVQSYVPFFLPEKALTKAWL